MSKHTPGPWRSITGQLVGCGPSSRYLHVDSTDGSRRACICQAVSDHPTEADYANFRLIAAAPELLALLRERVEWPIMSRAKVMEWTERAEAAIAKAEGGAC